jgi:hypothetical protein
LPGVLRGVGEVALELRAKRADLVGPAERVYALIQAALRCYPVRVERVVGGGRDPGGGDARAESLTDLDAPRRRPGCQTVSMKHRSQPAALSASKVQARLDG